MTSPEFDRLLAAMRRNPARPGVPIAQLRAGQEAAVARRPPNPDLVIEAVDVRGVPCELISLADGSSGRTLVHLHGGGYAMGSLTTVRTFASELARATRAQVLAVDYRLSPEHVFPAALNDVATAYRWLLDRGTRPGEVAFSGDSAGAALAVSVLLVLRDQGVTLPAACVCLSPWTDLTLSGASLGTEPDRDPLVDRAMLAELAAAYAGATPLEDPLVSPVHADLSGLPPILVQVGGAEALLDDGLAFAARAAACEVDVTTRVWDDMIHVWQTYAPRLPESRAAVEEVAEWLDAVWTAGASGRDGIAGGSGARA